MIKEKLKLLPSSPGCYIMRDSYHKVIYVGKAKNLKNRLRSYFTGKNNFKTEMMVSNINDFEYIITSNEKEAFILEINLIKKYNPKYNILLKDDKTYPYIELTKEEHPRLLITREPNKKSYLYGPYPNVYAARETLNLLNRAYPIRKCKNIGKKECLYYHIGECLGPCINKIHDKSYIESIKKFLKGNYKEIKKELTNKMKEHSLKLEYEKASEYKELINFIEVTLEKQQIVSKENKDIDVFGYYFLDGMLSISILFIRNGVVLSVKNDIVEVIDSYEEELLEYIVKYYEKNNLPDILYLPNIIEHNIINIINTKLLFPIRGEKKNLLDIAGDNAKNALEEANRLKLNTLEKTIEANKKIGELLQTNYPRRIEAFDNSNLFGKDAVSTMVVFIDGKPARKEYRKYKVKYTTKPDDYNTMKEVILRRYTRVFNEDLDKPDLILVDGGKGQVKVARDILKELGFYIPVAGLKKDNKHNLDSLVGLDPIEEIKIKKSTSEFRLLNKIAEEVHRFAITFHKNLRSKSNLYSELDSIEGIGEKRKRELLKRFGSIKKIKESSIEELSKVIPRNIAIKLLKRE
ncbi:MAG: excinuclease ABC subunit UvrC [Bacilli bacterium]